MAAVAALTAALLCLTGCDAIAGLVGSGGATPRSTPRPVVSASAPPLDCAAFTAAPPVEALLGGAAPLADSPADALTTPAGRGPFAAQAAGGGWCRWGDDPAEATASTSVHTPPVHTLSVQLLPRATAIWQRLTDQYPESAAMGAHYDGGESRGGECATAPGGRGSRCHTNVLVGASWLAVDAVSGTSVIDEKAFHALVQTFLPAAAAVDARSATPGPTASPRPLPCGGADWLNPVAGAFGPQTVTTLEPGESFGLATALLDVPGSVTCAYRTGGDGASGYLGTVSVLRDAADAYATYHSVVVDRDPDASGGTIESGGKQFATLVRTTAASGSTPAETVVDALVGDAWIQFAAQAGSDDQAAAVVQWVAGRL
ncbi:hypothetical protein KNO15_06325 [Leifsonia shinshuensis]|uniref:hypothetical protein n=1 Tax=Leifsonia shinshuensis TaxID=150026 RepID=UPI001F50CDD9|nr:hypothetical protein [Leifsonia shinshuensis]MCI0156309.1 hypothetical protein [Leifsonia shinshuensis]